MEMSGRHVVSIALFLVFTAAVARAAENEAATPRVFAENAASSAFDNVIQLPHIPITEARVRRPAMLPALYAGFVGLQILDARTTTGALNRGAYESNALLGQNNQARIWAVRAASTASTIYFVERMWKKNRVGAVLLMAGINGGYTAIAAHNLRQAR
jgi:hypothetical protein